MASLCFIFLFVLSRSLVWAGESCNNHHSEYGFALVDHVYKSFFADRLVSCYMSCTTQPVCQSLNYNLADKTCEFNNDTKYFRAKYFVEKPTFVYGENPDSGTFPVVQRISQIVLAFMLSRYFSSLRRQFLLAVYRSLGLFFGVFSHEMMNMNIVVVIFPSGIQYFSVHFWFNLYSLLRFSEHLISRMCICLLFSRHLVGTSGSCSWKLFLEAF